MNKKQSPFFAKFLENQEKSAVRGGETTKPTLDVMQTMKYPSDGDDDLEW